eukprot:scaffold62153_cov61-Phaeocystis_antarctica.AAC.14
MRGMSETFDAMTLVYLAELLYGDGHILTERVAEESGARHIPLATSELVDSTILHVVNRVFEDAFQLLSEKELDSWKTSIAGRNRSSQFIQSVHAGKTEVFGKRIDAMITFFRQILTAGNVYYIYLSTGDMSKSKALTESIFKHLSSKNARQFEFKQYKKQGLISARVETNEGEATVIDTAATEETADAAAAAKGLNDNAHGIDRFGYRVRCLPHQPFPALLPHRDEPEPVSHPRPFPTPTSHSLALA